MKAANIIKFTLVSYLLFLGSLGEVIAQNNNFKQWTIKDGLAQSTIYCIKQDKRGYLWIGTGGGLSCFDGKKFKNYTKKDGLVGNAIRSILEDSKGRLWFGTDEGISVYDGFTFKSITSRAKRIHECEINNEIKTNKQKDLSGSTVLCLLEDFENNILAGTDDGGINKIKVIKPDSFSIQVFNDTRGLSSNAVFDMIEDKDHSIWAATYNGGINALHPNKDGYTIKVISGKNNIPSDMLLTVSKDADGNLWFGSYDAGAFKLDISKMSNTQLPVVSFNSSNGLNSDAVWDILFTNSKNIWFATTENGIKRFIPQRNSLKYKIESYSTKQGLASNQILCFFEDREQNIWIGTNGDGLCMLTGDYFSHYTLKDGLLNTNVQAIDEDTNGNFWLATEGGLTVMNCNDGNPIYKNYTEKDGLSSNMLSSIAVGRATNQNVWLGTANKGIIKFDGKHFLTYNESNGLVSDRINCLQVDSKGILWCGTANGISRYDGVTFLNVSTKGMKMNDEGVKSIIEGKKGMLWFGSAGGLARYDGHSVLRTFDEVEGLKSKNVNTITEDEQGNIWIGTNDGGIFKFNIHKSDTTAIELIADEKILSSNSIHSLKFLNKNTLLVGTYKGFDKLIFDDAGKIIKHRNYNYSDGFVGLECNDNAIYKDKLNNIWFGTVNGLTRFNPQAEKTLPLLQVHLIGLQLFYQNIDWATKVDTVLPWFNLPKHLKLAYTENNLTFQFSAIALTNPDKVLYKYILEGRDENWSPAKETNEITYSGLLKGQYTFKVMAMDANGNWSEPTTFKITIAPPWFQTTWFYLIVIVIGVGTIYGYIKIRENKLQKEKRILEQTVAERTDEIVKQKDLIEVKQKEIIDSITYAKRLQQAIFPSANEIKKYLPDTFLYYKPKDIVAGDFYWMEHLDNMTYVAAADSTGHGVPGAMVSVVCSNALNRAVKEFGLRDTGIILNKTRELVLETFAKSGEEIKDGMDISMLRVELPSPSERNGRVRLQWSGANNPLWYVVNSPLEGGQREILEIKADKQPIGKTDNPKPFTTHTLELHKGDTIYLITDGYPDQFGGIKGKKFKYKPLEEMLVANSLKPLAEQRNILSQSFDNWKGSLEQVDDVTIVGIKV
ncbi:MAG: two-component regulator propeller domain-containing protein [Bacteroidia bacterium]